MNQTEQIRLAYETWEKVQELSFKLWDQYYDEFIDIILEKKDAKYYYGRHHENVDDVNL